MLLKWICSWGTDTERQEVLIGCNGQVWGKCWRDLSRKGTCGLWFGPGLKRLSGEGSMASCNTAQSTGRHKIFTRQVQLNCQCVLLVEFSAFGRTLPGDFRPRLNLWQARFAKNITEKKGKWKFGASLEVFMAGTLCSDTLSVDVQLVSCSYRAAFSTNVQICVTYLQLRWGKYPRGSYHGDGKIINSSCICLPSAASLPFSANALLWKPWPGFFLTPAPWSPSLCLLLFFLLSIYQH